LAFWRSFSASCLAMVAKSAAASSMSAVLSCSCLQAPGRGRVPRAGSTVALTSQRQGYGGLCRLSLSMQQVRAHS
jgi:hypothetical protein